MSAALLKAAKKALLAKAAFGSLWTKYWVGLEPLPADHPDFARLRQALKKEAEYFVFTRKDARGGVENACWELFRKGLVGEKGFEFELVARFVRGFGVLKGNLSRALDKVTEDAGYGDDGYEDFIDSLALGADDALLARCLATDPKSGRPKRDGFLDHKELDAAVKALGDRWAGFVGGEQYAEMHLGDAAKKAYLQTVLSGDEWTEAEKDKLTFVDLD